MEKELNRLLNELKGYAGKISPNLLPLINKFIESCKGGKGLRGKLVVLGYEIGKQSSAISYQSSDKDILKIAAAYEIMRFFRPQYWLMMTLLTKAPPDGASPPCIKAWE